MPRVGLHQDAVVDLALAIADSQGPEAVTLAAVATRAGVATPSLYKHVRNLRQLQELVSIRVIGELADRAAAALEHSPGGDGIPVLMREYRRYVMEHPGRYALMIQTPDPAVADASARLLQVVADALAGYGLTGPATVHVARCLRSAAHGFATLESAGGFGLPEKIDDSYELLVKMVVAGASDRGTAD